MGWHINLVKNEVKINSAIALELYNCDAQVCCAWQDECDFPMLEGIIYDGKLVFNSDHMEHMDYVWEAEVLEVLCKHKVKGDICFTSHDGDNAGTSWGYRFDGLGGQVGLTRGDGAWEETGKSLPRGKGVLTCKCGSTKFETIGSKNGPPRDKCKKCGKFDKTTYVHPFAGGDYAAPKSSKGKAKAERQAKSSDPLEDVRFAIENEGFDYAFRNYSDFSEIKDKKFHALRAAYVKAAEALADYVGEES